MGVPGPSSRGASAISRFLAEHQDHDAGFDVGRASSGTGRLKVVCLGCGASIEYRAAEGDPERLRLEAGPASRQERELPPRRKTADRAGRGRSGRPRAFVIAVGVAIAGLALIGILLLGQGGSDRPNRNGTTPPAPATVATVATPPATPTKTPTAKQAPRAPRLHPATYDDRFTIGVPGRWRSERRGAETVLLGPGGTPEIDVYYALDPSGLDELGRSTVRFLQDRHPSGHVTEPTPTRVADLPALRVRATYQGGSESALVLRSGGYAYLLVTRIARNDEAFRVRQATIAPESFRPL